MLRRIILQIRMLRKVFPQQAHELSKLAFRIVRILAYHEKRTYGSVVSIEFFYKPNEALHRIGNRIRLFYVPSM